MKNYKLKTVPNQRIITIHKEPTNRANKYTTNNLNALNQAVNDLQSKVGIKLYLYFASNQNDYKLALSSSDFCEWAGCGLTAYKTAFEELEQKGYLVQNGASTIYIFYDKAQINNESTKEKDSNIIEDSKENEIHTTEEYTPYKYTIEEIEIGIPGNNKPKYRHRQEYDSKFVF